MNFEGESGSAMDVGNVGWLDEIGIDELNEKLFFERTRRAERAIRKEEKSRGLYISYSVYE